jgi:antitoxin HicB
MTPPRSPEGRPYPVTVVWDESSDDRGWVATVDALSGCVNQADTLEEAVTGLAEVTENWIDVAKQQRTPIPEPRTTGDYSGRFVIRAPSSLHERLVKQAELENVSLNQFVTNALAAAVGWRVPRSEATAVGAADLERAEIVIAGAPEPLPVYVPARVVAYEPETG